MTSFPQFKATQKLKELAKQPLDLTKEGVLTPKRIDQMHAEALGFRLFYATERVTDDVLKALFDLAEESHAIKHMEEMQSGAMVNVSEKRAALHTAVRGFFDNPLPSSTVAQTAQLAFKELEKLRTFLEEVDDRFTDIVQIGIGGSELGPKAIYYALRAFHKPGRRAHFLSNIDPDEATSLLKSLDLSKTLFVAVSKSGKTLETLTNEARIIDSLKKAGLKPKEHLVSVTGKGSPMDDPTSYLASFYIWDTIGGRYSPTSMVGGVTLAFILGMDRFIEFLRGAHAMDKIALRKDPKANLPLLSALLNIWNRNFLEHDTFGVIPYAQALAYFPGHLQQLSMESNGKSVDLKGQRVDFGTGPIVWGETGTNGQHSFFQLLHQGTTIVPLELIGFCKTQYKEDFSYEGSLSQEKLLSNLFAQAIALAMGQKSDNPNKFFAGNRPSRILLTERLDPMTMGSLLAYYEHQVAFQGFIWNIDSFDQEGVELGKKLALKVIDQFKTHDPKNFPLGQAFLNYIGK